MMVPTRTKLVAAVTMALCGGAAFTVSPSVAFADIYYGNNFGSNEYGAWFDHYDNNWSSLGGDWIDPSNYETKLNSYLEMSGNTVTVDSTSVASSSNNLLAEKLIATNASATLSVGAGTTFTIKTADGGTASITSGTSSTTLSAATSNNGLAYDGFTVDASTGSISSLDLENTTATLTGTLNARSVNVTGTTLTASSGSLIKTDSLTVSSSDDVANLLASGAKLRSSSGGYIQINTSDGNGLSDDVATTLIAQTPSNTTLSYTNSNGETVTPTGTKEVTTKADTLALGNTMVSAASELDATEEAAADTRVANLKKDLFANELPKASDLSVASKLDAYFAANNAYQTSPESFNEAHQ